MTIDLETIDHGEDADYAIDSGRDKCCISTCYPASKTVHDAICSVIGSHAFQVIASHGPAATTRMIIEMALELGVRNRDNIANMWESGAIALTPERKAIHQRSAMMAASRKTAREIDLEHKLEHTQMMLDHYARLARGKAA